MQKPKISVIVATRNEERNIERCLISIKAMNYPQDKIEVMVVDNNSSDDTKKLAIKHFVDFYDLSEIMTLDNVKNFRGAQINFGVDKAKGDIIFFPDTDMTFDPDLMNEAVGKIVVEKYDALFIPEIVNGKGLFGKIRNFERSFYNMTCIDGVRIVKKEVFDAVGGFDIDKIAFGFDDWDFTKALKKNNKVGITQKSLSHHEEELTLGVYLSKKAKYSATADDYINKWGKDDQDVKKQFSAKYRFLDVFIENKKWKKLARSPLLALGMISLRFFVGLSFLTRKKL